MNIAFNITNVASTKNVDTSIAIVNTLIAPVVKKSLTDADIPLFYYKGQDLTINDIVHPVADDFGKNNVFISDSSIFNVRTSNIKVTNVVNSFSDETIPLWYYHVGVSYLSKVGSSANVIDMRLLTAQKSVVNNRLWRYDSAEKRLYTSLNNHIDVETGNDIIFFVETVYDNGSLALDILNAIDVIRKTNLSSIIPRISVDSFVATAVGVSSSRLYIFEDIENAFDMGVDNPIESGVYNLTIRRSSVQNSGGTDIAADTISTGEIKNLSGTSGYLVDNYTIKINMSGSLLIPGHPLIDEGIIPAKNSNIIVYVYDKDRNLKHILTNYDAGGAQVIAGGDVVEYGFNIKSVSSDGYLALDIPLDLDDMISVAGNYFSDYYTYTALNLRSADGDYDIYYDPISSSDPFVLSQVALGAPNVHIGSVGVNNTRINNDLITLDLRERGGGLDNSKLSEANSIYPEVIFFNDTSNIYDLSLYIGPSYIVEVPGPEVLDSINGSFSDAKIDTIVQRSTNANTTAIKRFYNIKPTISSVAYPAALAIDINWIDIQGFSYRVWISTDNNNYVDDSGLLAPSTVTHQYTYLASQQDTLIYVKIEGLYTNSLGQVIDSNFSDIYTVMLI